MTRHTCTRLGLAIVTSEGCEACAAERDGTVSDDAIERIRERWRPEIDLVPVLRGARADVRTLLDALDESRREVERLRAEGMCDACAGTGEALSGPCGCGGTGRAVDLLREVRDVLARTEAEAERLRTDARRAARAELLAEIAAREPATDADVRAWLLLDAVADARRAALEEVIALCGAPPPAYAAGAKYCTDLIRDMLTLDALRADQPVRPAPASASEET